jgi:PhoD-like phosphatase, N-terminal domain
MPKSARIRRPDFDDDDIPDLNRSTYEMSDAWGVRAGDDHDRDDHDRDDHHHGEGNEHIPPLPYDATAFPDGVSSGDVTQTSAVLWARASQTGKVTFQIATDSGFHHIVDTRTVSVSNTLVPAKVEVDDLNPNQRYYYRALDASGHVAEGTLETAAKLGHHEGFSFGVGGDTRGADAENVVMDQIPPDRMGKEQPTSCSTAYRLVSVRRVLESSESVVIREWWP